MSVLVIIHGVVGTIALLSGIAIIFFNKFNKPLHVTIGYIFCVATLISSLFGIYVAIDRDILVLVGIGIATILQVLFGIRALYNRKYINSVYDHFLSVAFFSNLVFLLYIGTSISYAILAIYLCVFAVHVYNMYIKRNKEKTLYLAQHISHMFGAIASVITAVIIGALGSFSIYWVFWFIPSVVFIFIVRYFRLKYAPIRAWNFGGMKW